MSDEMVTWRGKRIDDMSREELLKAFKQLGRMHKEQHEQHMGSWARLREWREFRINGHRQ